MQVDGRHVVLDGGLSRGFQFGARPQFEGLALMGRRRAVRNNGGGVVLEDPTARGVVRSFQDGSPCEKGFQGALAFRVCCGESSGTGELEALGDLEQGDGVKFLSCRPGHGVPC